MERVPKPTTVDSSMEKSRQYKALFKKLEVGLYEIPRDATEEDLQRYREDQRDALGTLEHLMGVPEFSHKAIAFLVAMSHIPSKEESYTGLTELDHENGAEARKILSAHKDLLLEDALNSEFEGATALTRIQHIPGCGEEIDLYLKEQVSNAGFDVAGLEKVWAQTARENELPRRITENLFQLLRLERDVPGSAKELHSQFGITCFARYPLEVLKEQYENRSRADLPYGAMLYPQADWNGAFYSGQQMISDLHSSLAGTYQLRILEGETKIDVVRKLLSLNQMYAEQDGGHKIAFAIICGHGKKDAIHFGGDDEKHFLKVSDLSGKGAARTSSFFEEHPTVVLSSCSTGMEGGVAEELSRALQATVIAPDGVTSTESIVFDKVNGFSVKYRGVATKKYVNGAI